jgi:hypothetical protein
MTGQLAPQDGAPFRPGTADRAEVARLVAEGLLRPLAGPVHVGAHAPDTEALRARSVLLALAPPGGLWPIGACACGVVGFATAAWVHTGGPAASPIDLIIAPGSTRPRQGRMRLHEHRLAPREVHLVAGLRLTSPVRTAADLARSLPAAQVAGQLERLRGGCGVRAVDVVEQLEGMTRCRGVARARDLVLAWASSVASAPLV